MIEWGSLLAEINSIQSSAIGVLVAGFSVAAVACVFMYFERMVTAGFIMIGALLIMAVSFVMIGPVLQTSVNKLNDEIQSYLVEELGVETAPNISAASELRGMEVGDFAKQEVALKIDGGNYITTLVFTVESEDVLNLGVMDGSTSNVLPLTQESVMNATHVTAIGE